MVECNTYSLKEEEEIMAKDMSENKKFVESITSRDEDFAQWYTDIVKQAKLCDYSSVKGFLNYLPNGYAIWENIQADLDKRFKETGVENVYLPVLIPESLLEKEADHIEGFGFLMVESKDWRKSFVLDRLQKLYSVIYGKEVFNHIEIYRKYGINGTQ